jgi:hypothetical protein
MMRSSATTIAEPAIAVERLAKVPTPRGTTSLSPNRKTTSPIGTPSRSAAIWANVVSCPCPCGEEELPITTRPLGSTLASALSHMPPARSTYIATPVPLTGAPGRRGAPAASSSATSRQRS